MDGQTRAVADTATRATLIRDLPAAERPRERLRDAGADKLSNVELLAVLLRTGTMNDSALSLAEKLLARFGGITGVAHATIHELCEVDGIGEAKAAQLKAALELGSRAARDGKGALPVVRSADDIAALVLDQMSLLEQEEVRVFVLDARNRIVAEEMAYKGSVHTAHVRLAEIFSGAVRRKASAIVVVHNHPSGDPTPSAADIQLTKQLVEASRLLEIDVLDHIVIGGGRYASLATLRLGFPQPLAKAAHTPAAHAPAADAAVRVGL
jgi:DNA repair protein RadC